MFDTEVQQILNVNKSCVNYFKLVGQSINQPITEPVHWQVNWPVSQSISQSAGVRKAQFKCQTLHVLNSIPIWVDSNN